jgi:hypothetical protein
MTKDNDLRDEIFSEQEDKCFEPDASPKACEHYEKYYGIIENCKKELRNTRLIYSKNLGITKNDIIDISGDCSFNFNDDKLLLLKEIIFKLAILKELLSKTQYEELEDEIKKLDDKNKKRGKIKRAEKIKLIEGFIKKTESEKPEIKKLKEVNKKLINASTMHHTLLNFDLMPVTGGLNNLKGNLKFKDSKILVHGIGRRPILALDRLDTFLYFLDFSMKKRDEYEEKLALGDVKLEDIGEFFSNSVFTFSLSGENFLALYDFLKKYKNINEYCKVFYFPKCNNENIEKLIKDLIKSGEKAIDSVKSVEEYIDLANKFWKVKEDCFKPS